MLSNMEVSCSHLHGDQPLGEVDLRVLDALNCSHTNRTMRSCSKATNPEPGSVLTQNPQTESKVPREAFLHRLIHHLAGLQFQLHQHCQTLTVSTVTHRQTSACHRLTFLQVTRVSGCQDVDPRTCFSFFPTQRCSESLETPEQSRSEVSLCFYLGSMFSSDAGGSSWVLVARFCLTQRLDMMLTAGRG